MKFALAPESVNTDKSCACVFWGCLEKLAGVVGRTVLEYVAFEDPWETLNNWQEAFCKGTALSKTFLTQ